MKLSIIIPVYFNADTLGLLYDDLKEKVLDKIEEYELILVDDSSGDNSWNVMQGLMGKDKNIRLIKLSRNFGEHSALLAGLSICTGDAAITKAADMQEDSEIIFKMYDSYKKGNKVVLAVREDREEGIFQKMFAGIYYLLVRKLIIPTMPKGGFDCFLIDRKVIEVIKLLDEKNSSLVLQVLWAGFKTDIVYYVRRARKFGVSRWTFGKKFKLVMDSLTGFSYAPIRFISIIGTFFFVFSILTGVYFVIEKLIYGSDVPGWTSLIVLSMFSFGTIMITLGLLGEYIRRILDASRNRPPYIIEEIKENK